MRIIELLLFLLELRSRVQASDIFGVERTHNLSSIFLFLYLWYLFSLLLPLQLLNFFLFVSESVALLNLFVHREIREEVLINL